MTVIEPVARQLAIISAIAPTPELLADLDQLGTVRWLIVPNLYHHTFVGQFHQHYPQAEVWIPPDLRRKRPDLMAQGLLTETPWPLAGVLDFCPLQGFQLIDLAGFVPLQEIVFYHSTSQTLILTDACFNFDRSFPLATRWAGQCLRSYGQLRPSILEKLATRDKLAVRQSVEQILQWAFQRIVVAHGAIVTRHAKAQFQQGFEWFLDSSLALD